MKERVIVLYEDSRAARVQGVGPHELTLKLVADARGEEYVGGVGYSPVRGRDNLLSLCRRLEQKLPSRQIVALLDDDRIRDSGLLKVPASSCRKVVVQAIMALSDAPERLHVVLLDHNLEHVLRELQKIGIISGERIARAIEKELVQRDLALRDAARAPRHIRDQLVERVPSLGRLRDTIVRLLQD